MANDDDVFWFHHYCKIVCKIVFSKSNISLAYSQCQNDKVLLTHNGFIVPAIVKIKDFSIFAH